MERRERTRLENNIRSLNEKVSSGAASIAELETLIHLNNTIISQEDQEDLKGCSYNPKQNGRNVGKSPVDSF